MNLKDKSYIRSFFFSRVRSFFERRLFQEIIPPPLVENPGMESHLHPFSLFSPLKSLKIPYYLHTSPEYFMKEILASGTSPIYAISYCFREEPLSPIHRIQFLMLEWYRADHSYFDIMKDCEDLIVDLTHLLKKKNLPLHDDYRNNEEGLIKMTIREIFLKVLQIDILLYLKDNDIKNLILEHFPDLYIDPAVTLDWEDYYFLIFLNKIEPFLKKYPILILYEFPIHLSALSEINERDPRVCDRFELYMHGIEVGNCFQELINFKECMRRLKRENAKKKKLYGYSLDEPKKFYRVMQKGYPKSSGIALGLERLMMCLTGLSDLF